MNIQKQDRYRIVVYSVFIILYLLAYNITTNDKKNRISQIQKLQIQNLKNHYEISKQNFHIISQTANHDIFSHHDVLNILYRASNTTDKSELALLRKELYELIKPHLDNLQQYGVNIILFAFENNKTFLRVHKPKKFDDDLSQVRYSFKYVNEHKKPIEDFEQGKISHAFRNITPLYYKEKYVGSIDISFSSEIMQENMKTQYDIDTHFILNKNLFASNIWKAQKKVKYIQSIEHKDFLFSLTPSLKINAFSDDKIKIVKALKDEISKNTEHGKSFALNYLLDDSAYVIAFLPIKNLREKKTVAYLVSYTKSSYLKTINDQFIFINIGAIIVLLSIALFLTNILKQRLELREKVKERTQELENANKILEEERILLKKLSTTDQLTGLYNRYKIEETFIYEQKQSQRNDEQLSCIIIDIDYFKSVNDTYGHNVGDIILKEIAEILKDSFRQTDTVGRWGGEEFLAILPNTKLNNAKDIAEKIKSVIEDKEFTEVNKITASFGVSTMGSNETLKDVIYRADEALYKAKENGRNRVEVGL